MGSSCLKNLRANASLMTATCRDVAVSCSEIPRPLRMGFPIASKYPAVTRSQEAELSSLGAGAGRPSTHTTVSQLLPLSGEYVQIATAEMPGMLASES